MKTGEWNETFSFDEEVDTDLTTVYENNTDNIIMDSLSVAGKYDVNNKSVFLFSSFIHMK